MAKTHLSRPYPQSAYIDGKSVENVISSWMNTERLEGEQPSNHIREIQVPNAALGNIPTEVVGGEEVKVVFGVEVIGGGIDNTIHIIAK